MKIEVSSGVEYGRTSDQTRVTFTLLPENDHDRALIHSVYGLKAKVSACAPFVALSFTRKVEF
jgi:hypothetical protein